MVRIIEEKPKAALDEQGKTIFSLLGIVVADQPERLQHLLLNYGIELKNQSNSGELTDAAIYAISKNDQQFATDLAKLFAEQIIPDENDSFDTKDLAGAAKDTKITVGTNPISAIGGAIGSIFNFAGSLTNRKELKKQARRQSMQSMMLYQAQQEQTVAKAHSEATKVNVIKVVGVLALIALLGGLFMFYKHRAANSLKSNL